MTLRTRHKVVLEIALFLACAVVLAGCEAKFRRASIASRDLAIAVQGFQDMEIVLHQQGKVSDEEHQRIQNLLLQVGQSGQQLDNYIRAAKDAKGTDAQLQAFLSAVDNLNKQGLIGIKNSEAKASLTLAISTIAALSATIAAALI